MKKISLGLVALVVLLSSLLPLAARAQCVMCKSQVEAARAENDDFSPAGLNKGIVYMMTIPYILMGAIGYAWYRRTHPKQAKA
jgi:hypothetical protein